MKLLLFISSFFGLSFIFASNAYAIVVIVPAILIPIVNLVVWIVGAVSVPVAGVLFAYSKVKKVSHKKILSTLFIVLFLVALITFILLRIVNPDRPIY